MKYIYISLICFFIMLALCSYSSVQVIKTVDETTQILKTAIDADQSGHKEETISIVKKASEAWKSHELFFGTVLRHDEVDEVVEEFARLESYAATEDQDDFLSNCRALIARLEHIQTMEKPTLQNIM